MKTTTLAKIRECRPCQSSWKRLLDGLGKSEADDEPLPYASILEICGLNDALWATRTEEDFGWVQELLMKFALHEKQGQNSDGSELQWQEAEFRRVVG